MRLTIVPDDKLIRIDEQMLSDIGEDLSWIPSNVHAVQWYDTWGEVEYNDGSPNERIDNLGIYSTAVQTFQSEVNRLEVLRIQEEELRESLRDYWAEFRDIRNYLLTSSDWTQLADTNLTEVQKNDWASYRQQLRDLPSLVEDPKPLVLDPNHPTWPILPS